MQIDFLLTDNVPSNIGEPTDHTQREMIRQTVDPTIIQASIETPTLVAKSVTAGSKGPRKSTAVLKTTVQQTTASNKPPGLSSRDTGNRQNYISLLSRVPAEDTNKGVISTSTEDTQPYDQNDPVSVWKYAIGLASKGDIEGASSLFKRHADLLAKASPAANSTRVDRTEKDRTENNRTESRNNVIIEGGLKFIPGAITSHADIGFTPYFDKNLKELKGPLPLTIFNKQWQDLANSYHVEKRVKTDNINKDTTTYTGYPYPHEMTQPYAVWNVNYRNFVTTLRDVYKFKLFASWAETHQANVEFYHARDNWMTAFRYDIKIRMNAFAFRVSENGNDAPPDISQRREDVAAICFAETRKLDEGSFTDNPYARGGPKYGYDWTTGLPRSHSHGHNHNYTSANFANADSYPSGSTPNNNHSPSNGNPNSKRPAGRSDGYNNNGNRGKTGYNRKNFDPNYAAKKAAASAPKQPAAGSGT